MCMFYVHGTTPATEHDLGYLLKTAFRAHPAVKKAKRGKKGVRWEGLAAA